MVAIAGTGRAQGLMACDHGAGGCYSFGVLGSLYLVNTLLISHFILCFFYDARQQILLL